MVGNDIVDMAEAKKSSNWQRSRFLDKLFTSKEKEFIHHSEDASAMVWRLWSMKEAAYKLYVQLNPMRFYAPKQFECTISGCNGKVNYKAFECSVRTKVTLDYVHSEAYLTYKHRLLACIHLNDDSYKIQSQFVKHALLTIVSNKLNLIKSDLKIKKSEFGMPIVYYKAKKLDLSISISHHGHYGAYMISF